MLISEKEFKSFLAGYYFFKNFNSPERLGQKFLNKYFPEEINPALFYVEDEEKAIKLIYEQYIST